MPAGATSLTLIIPGRGTLMANIPTDDCFPVMCVGTLAIHFWPFGPTATQSRLSSFP